MFLESPPRGDPLGQTNGKTWKIVEFINLGEKGLV